MAKKKAKKKAPKKKGKKTVEKTEEDIFLEQLTVIVAERLKREVWDVIDAQMKKKLTKKEKARLALRRAEELKQAVEAERIHLIEEEKRRQELERQAAIEKEQRDGVEQSIRMKQLMDSQMKIKEMKKELMEKEEKILMELEWEQYLKCDGLPDPSNCGEMNTYLHLWDQIRDVTTPEFACQKTDEVMKLLNTLDIFLDNSTLSANRRQNWQSIHQSFLTAQHYNLDSLTYHLLRDICNKLIRLNIGTATRVVCHPRREFVLCLWALIQLPIPMPNPKKPPQPPIVLKFDDVKMEVSCPQHMDVWAMCIRAMFVVNDHLSRTSASFQEPPLPDEMKKDLFIITSQEWFKKLKIIQDVRKQEKAERDKLAKQAIALAQSTESEEAQAVAQAAIKKQKEYIKVDASSMYLVIEDEEYSSFRKKLQIKVPPNVINLRKYHILGGIYHLNLFYQPPQPITMVLSEISFTTLQIPKWLHTVPFHQKFIPPPAPEPGTVRKPEEIEEEIKKVEAEYTKLLEVTIALPEGVLWLDQPLICQWDDEMNVWCTDDVHDVKYNEEKLTMQFKTGKFGIFGMALFRYNNMPFQAWELKPSDKEELTLTIIAAVLILEFTIRADKICLSQLQNAPNSALDHLLNKWMSVAALKRNLRQGGVDIFPTSDSFCYMTGVCEKQMPFEYHLYYNIAQCAMYFNFAWSRWNLPAGRRTAIMQMREFTFSDRSKQQVNYSMLMVTPLKALLVDCSEVSQAFSEEPTKKMKFYSDLYHLILGTTTVTMKCKLEKTPVDLINTVAQLLQATRVLSLS